MLHYTSSSLLKGQHFGMVTCFVNVHFLSHDHSGLSDKQTEQDILPLVT